MRIAMQKLFLCEQKASVRSRVGCVLLLRFKTSSALPLLLSLLLLGWAATLGANVINVETHVNESHRPENTRDACV